jgi:hypothetical protein
MECDPFGLWKEGEERKQIRELHLFLCSVTFSMDFLHTGMVIYHVTLYSDLDTFMSLSLLSLLHVRTFCQASGCRLGLNVYSGRFVLLDPAILTDISISVTGLQYIQSYVEQ